MTNTGEAESDESTQSKQEWYLLTEQLSALAPAIILLEETNNDGKNSRSLEQLKQNWMTFVSSSLKSKKPVRDLIIRNKVYALSQIHKHKPPYPDEAYRKHFKNKYFYIEFKFFARTSTSA